jgi:hypothetical protein
MELHWKLPALCTADAISVHQSAAMLAGARFVVACLMRPGAANHRAAFSLVGRYRERRVYLAKDYDVAEMR